MHFAPIAPIEYLERYSGRSYVQLALAQWLVRDTRYYEWYRGRVAAGDFVIIDNGCYEGETVEPHTLVELYDALYHRRPSTNLLCTVPDTMGDPVASYKQATEFLGLWGDRMRIGLLRVLQTYDCDPYEVKQRAEEEVARNFTWMALPRRLGKDARITAASFLRTLPVRLHAFGWTGSLDELRLLAKVGVRTCDSSGPVWRALCSGLTEKRYHEWKDIKFDPLASNFDENRLVLADVALTETFRACNSL